MRTAWITLANQRPWLFKLINRQRILTDPTSIWAITLDNPTPEVVRAVDEVAKLDKTIIVNAAPFSPLGDTERFNELRAWQVDQLRDFGPDYFVLQDDDHILSAPAALRYQLQTNKPFPGQRARPLPDIVYATKLFFWDNMATTNSRLPPHRSSFMFRMPPDESFPPRLMDEARRDPKTVVAEMQQPLFDIGYLLESERRRVWEAYKRVGKIDAATKPLIEKPKLVPFIPATPSQFRYQRALHTALRYAQ